MIRAVLDTNILASGFTHRKGNSGLILSSWRGRAFEVIVSDHILDELEEAFEDRYFKKRLTKRHRKRVLALLRRQAILTDITVEVTGIAPSPEDDLILSTALSGGAGYVVTGDAEFLRLGEYEGVRILTPRAFLEMLASSQVDEAE